MFQFERNRITIFNILFIPVLICIWIIALFSGKIFDTQYADTAILPIIFLLGYFFFLIIKKNRIFDIHLIIILLFFVKLYILPILVLFNGGFDSQQYNAGLINHIFDAVLLQTIEWFVVIIGLSFIKIEKKEINIFERAVDSSINKKVWKVIFLCLFIIALAIILYPSLLYKFRPIFFLSEEQEILWKQNSTVAASSIHPLIYYPVNWLITVTRISFIYLLIILIWKKCKNKSEIVSIVFSFVVIAIGLVLIVPDDVAASIIAALGLFALMTKLYPKKSKQIVLVVLITAGILFVYMFFGRALTAQNSFEQLAKRLNAYFSGFINVAASFDMECDNKFSYFFGDFFRSFPIIKGFFVNMPTSTELFNSALGYDTIYNSQIIPMEGQAYFYSNYIGVIVIPILILKICFYFYNKTLRAKGTYDYFINSFYSLILAFGIVMYDSFLIFYICLSYVPLLIINIFIKRKGVKRNERVNIS